MNDRPSGWLVGLLVAVAIMVAYSITGNSVSALFTVAITSVLTYPLVRLIDHSRRRREIIDELYELCGTLEDGMDLSNEQVSQMLGIFAARYGGSHEVVAGHDGAIIIQVTFPWIKAPYKVELSAS